MNKILEYIIEQRKGHYCHALEVHEAYELESIAEGLINELGDKYTELEYIEFFESMSIYYLGEDSTKEQEVYNFNFKEYIEGTLW